MKKKINRQLMIIAALAVIGMLFFMSVGFYRIFRSQVMEDLKNYADVLSKSDILQEPEVKRYDFEKDNVRTTVVTPEGQVIYDSNANVGEMDNHAGRPEIKEALKDSLSGVLLLCNGILIITRCGWRMETCFVWLGNHTVSGVFCIALCRLWQ